MKKEIGAFTRTMLIILLGIARKNCLPDDETDFSFSNAVYAFDSTTIDLCLNVFCGLLFEGQRVL